MFEAISVINEISFVPRSGDGNEVQVEEDKDGEE